MTNPQASRASHARRSAETQAAFLLPHLEPGMDLLDLGCGPGTITVGLAARVAPGKTTGIDTDPSAPENGYDISLATGDVNDLPFPDDSFDAIFASALLQHVSDPLRVLHEARRVARKGAVIGIIDADWGGELIHPTNPLLERSREIGTKLREGTSPHVGRRLRALLSEAGFVRAEAFARAAHWGTPDEIANVAGAMPRLLLGLPKALERITSNGWATSEELDEMVQAWADWADEPGAFLARFWCEAIAWAD